MSCPLRRPVVSRLAVACLAAATVGAAAGRAAEAPAREPPRALEEAFDPRGPVSIRSDALEAVRLDDGSERVRFEGSVVVEQGDLELRCERLEARYPPGGGGPAELRARGDVRIRQPGVEIRCAEALLDRTEGRALCTGGEDGAWMIRGEDRVRGERITLDLARDTIRVEGRARVELAPRKPEGGGAGEAGEGAP